MTYHLMTATIRDYDGSVTWHVQCPHDGRGDDRDCKWGEEAPGCLWYLWDVDAHHPECRDVGDCEEASGGAYPTTPFGCWEHEPEECNGFMAEGHCHPVEGLCGLDESVGIVWEDAVVWDDSAEGHPIDGPIAVRIAWDDGCAVLTPVREEVASDAA